MSSTNTAVLITIPNFLTIKPVQQCVNAIENNRNILPKIQPTPQLVATPGVTTTAVECKGKKRRLDHLTWEEKMQRKKLKNRVAAQTSRDRKKALMEEMENEIKHLTDKTTILENKCQSLQLINGSLLEKNQKLDMELETVRKQLHTLREQQSKGTQCDGSGFNLQRLSVNTGFEVEKEPNSGIVMANNSPLSALQDTLLSSVGIEQDEAPDSTEFYTGKLEELAETLLADISADLESSNRAGDTITTKTTSTSERLPRSVVGTATERMESDRHNKKRSNCLESKNFLEVPQEENNNSKDHMTYIKRIFTNPSIDKIYGTYDAKTNSISIDMDDGTIPVNEVVEEIYCDGARTESSLDDLLNTSRDNLMTASHISLNSDNICDEEFDKNELYSIDTFNSLLPKSPAHSAISDHGYESIISSPRKIISSPQLDLLLDDINDDFKDWPSSFNELFPNLY